MIAGRRRMLGRKSNVAEKRSRPPPRRRSTRDTPWSPFVAHTRIGRGSSRRTRTPVSPPRVGEGPCGRTMAKVIQRLRGVAGTLREQVCLGIGQPSPHSTWTSIDLLGWWIRQPNQRGRQRARRPTTSPPPGIRFAFYGRMSTVDFQDRTSSCRWQRNHADDQIADHGRILVEFAATARAGCRWRARRVRVEGSTRRCIRW